MQQCIYYMDEKLSYEKREHVIPAFLGGMTMLEKGTVSDEANELFSKWEMHVSQETILAMQRMFYGPGKRGSQNPKKRERGKICIMESRDNEDVTLGYIHMGKPKEIPQMQIPFKHKFEKGENVKIRMLIDAEDKDRKDEVLKEVRVCAGKYNNEFVKVLKDDSVPLEMAIVGFYRGNTYLGIHPDEDVDAAKKIVSVFMSKMDIVQWKSFETNEADGMQDEIHTHYVNSKYEMSMNINIYLRFIAKIAFNTCAYLNGSEYMMDSCFDNLRNAILTGENIQQYVWMSEAEERQKHPLEQLMTKGGWDENSHIVLCVSYKDAYYALVMLYGALTPVTVKLADAPYRVPCHVSDGFLCDWKNRREMDLEEFCRTIAVKMARIDER